MEISVEGKGEASPYPEGQDPLDKIAQEEGETNIADTNEVQEDAIEQSDLEELTAEDMVSEAVSSGQKSGVIVMPDGTKIKFETEEEDVKPGQEPVLEEAEGREDPMPSEPQKEAFDPTAIQHPLKSSDGPEGGVARTSANGPTMSSVDNKNAGGMLKPTADMMADSKPNKYEMSGFEVEYEANGRHHRVLIRDYFDDIDSAKATITGNQYLMPMPGGSFKLAKISGTPTISLNDRELVSIKNGEWSRK